MDQKLAENGDYETMSVFWDKSDPDSLKYGATKCETTTHVHEKEQQVSVGF